MGLKYSLGLALSLFGALIQGTPLCDETKRVEISNSTLSSAGGLNFTEGTFWYHQDGATYGCPCLLKSCLKPCIDNMLDKESLLMIHGKSEHVHLHEHFHLLNPVNAIIEGSLMCFDVKEPHIEILMNGSLIFLESGTIVDIERFCINSVNGSINAVVCEFESDQEENQDTNAHSRSTSLLYAILACVSTVFLFLVVAFYFLIPEMRTLQNRSVVCQSATLAIGFVSLSVLHLHSDLKDSPVTCKVVAHLSQYFILSSFAWLTTMCFDMLWTFSTLKNMAGKGSGKLKFKVYGAFATLCPLVPVSLTVILDFTLSKESVIWPSGIGENNGCWFKNRTSEFWFFQGPLLLMLLCNVGFSLSTLASIYKIKNGSKLLNESESRTYKSKENWQNLWLTVKLFTLMGGTWLMEFVTWALDEDGLIAVIFDSVNILRGPLIFYLCIIGNTKVRKAILSRLKPKVTQPSLFSRSTTNNDLVSGTVVSSCSAQAEMAL